MIQRIQTLYLLLAEAVLIVCLCLPIGSIEPQGMGSFHLLYNIGIYQEQGFVVRPILFADIVITAILSSATVCMYRRRPLQMRLCKVGILLCLLWYAYYAYSAFIGLQANGNIFHVRLAASFPLIAIILMVLAHRSIKADERLVKSMDRIR